jgi:predicted aspartyl protease
MPIGRYVGTSLRPMIEAHVSIPSINAGGFVQFLIDTGADCTTITPADGRRLRVEYSRLTREDHSMGYSGSTMDFVCDGTIVFAEIGVVEYEFDVELRLARPNPDTPELLMLPSLLGRDVLNRWKLTFDPADRTITADVLSCSRRSS